MRLEPAAERHLDCLVPPTAGPAHAVSGAAQPGGRPLVYDAAAGAPRGLPAWRGMVAGLWQHRGVVWQLMRRDLLVRSRQSLLGWVWMLLLPLLPVLLFTAVASYRVLDLGEPRMPYALFALCNVTLWQFFAGAVLGVSSSLGNAGSLVTRLSFPRECVLVAALGQPLLELAVRLPLVLAGFAWFGLLPPATALLVPLLLPPLLLLALGIGFVLSILSLVVRDIASVLGIVLTVGMFLSPVLYTPPVAWPFSLVNVLNPVSPFLVALQDLLAGGLPGNGTALALASLGALLLFAVGWRVFTLALPRILERT